jgi:hypothetical protein
MRRHAAMEKRMKSATAAVITPMEMLCAQVPAERAGRQRHLAASSPWEGSGMAVEEEAEAAAGGTIRAGDVWLGFALTPLSGVWMGAMDDAPSI